MLIGSKRGAAGHRGELVRTTDGVSIAPAVSCRMCAVRRRRDLRCDVDGRIGGRTEHNTLALGRNAAGGKCHSLIF